MDFDILGGYAPDADPTTPGILVECSKAIPTLKGMAGAPTPVATTLPALAAQCTGAAVLSKLDGSTRLVAGTGVALYEATTSSWTTVTRSVGGAYAQNSGDRWRFAQFGDISLAVTKTDTLQFSQSGSFANVTGAPKAAIVETVGYFVFLFDTNEGTYGDSTNRWWCSAIGNYTSWTPSIATQATTGVLTSIAGGITAGRRFGDNIIVYKQRGMYIGTYQGPPIAWAFQEVPGNAGALTQEWVVNVGTAENPRHIFGGYDDFYSFDGSRPVPIGIGRVREYVFNQINRTKLSACITGHDAANTLIYFYYPTGDSLIPDRCVVYNYRTDKWGKANLEVEAAVEYVAGGMTYDSVGTTYPTYSSFSSLPYDSQFFAGSTPIPAVFDTSHTIGTMTGTTTDSSITLSEAGDEEAFTTIRRTVPRWLTCPSEATMVNFYKHERSNGFTLDKQTGMVRSRFDVLRSSRWHQLRFDMVGDWEFSKLRAVGVGDGDE